MYLERLILGMIKEKIYFPVQRGLGFKMAGVGNFSSYPTHIIKFITSSFSIKVSLRVKSMTPRRASYTIPITGLLSLGETI